MAVETLRATSLPCREDKQIIFRLIAKMLTNKKIQRILPEKYRGSVKNYPDDQH
jgi:hypothetical protein